MRYALKAARLKAKMDVKEVAQALKIKPSTYYKWEQGTREPSHEHMGQLSKLFNETVDALFFNISLDKMSRKTKRRA